MPLYQIFMMPSTSSTELTFLNCSGNALTTLDVSDCPNLTTLYCSVNALTTLDVSNNTSLTELYCTGMTDQFAAREYFRLYIPEYK